MRSSIVTLVLSLRAVSSQYDDMEHRKAMEFGFKSTTDDSLDFTLITSNKGDIYGDGKDYGLSDGNDESTGVENDAGFVSTWPQKDAGLPIDIDSIRNAPNGMSEYGRLGGIAANVDPDVIAVSDGDSNTSSTETSATTDTVTTIADVSSATSMPTTTDAVSAAGISTDSSTGVPAASSTTDGDSDMSSVPRMMTSTLMSSTDVTSLPNTLSSSTGFASVTSTTSTGASMTSFLSTSDQFTESKTKESGSTTHHTESLTFTLTSMSLSQNSTMTPTHKTTITSVKPVTVTMTVTEPKRRPEESHVYCEHEWDDGYANGARWGYNHGYNDGYHRHPYMTPSFTTHPTARSTPHTTQAARLD